MNYILASHVSFMGSAFQMDQKTSRSSPHLHSTGDTMIKHSSASPSPISSMMLTLPQVVFCPILFCFARIYKWSFS